MPKWNHAFDIGFEVITKNDGDKVTGKELLEGLKRRLKNMETDYLKGGDEIIEACGLPFDSFEIEEK